MKIIWEAKDIRAGRKVCLPGPGTELWIIAYHPGVEKKGNAFTLVSARDGLIMHDVLQDAASIVAVLNHHCYVPHEWNL